jgi:subtilisin family serine protease
MSYTRPRLTAFVGVVIAIAALFIVDLPAQNLAREERAVERFRGRDVAAREVLVGFRAGANLARLRRDVDADEDTPVGAGRLRRMRSRSRGVASLIASLRAHPDIAYVEPNYIVYATAEPNDPRFGELWGLLNTGQVVGELPGVPGADISALGAWDKAIGSRNVVVGIVDTGIDYNHPDLAGNVWSAPAPFTVTLAGRTITCPAGTHGYNAINRSCDPFDDHSHGTHVAGTIGALGNNGTGVTGVNWLANIMALKFLGPSGSGTLANAIDAIEFAVQAKARFGQGANVRILSNSWGGAGFSQAFLDEIVRASQSDMLFVAAAGNSAGDNDAVPTYPSNYVSPNVVAVAATDNQDNLAVFSNYGAQSVHLGAPGVKVLSTIPGGGYASFSGTSMATPHVSGVAALLLSRCPVNTAALKSLILSTVDPVPSLTNWTVTGGRVNAERALASCGRASNLAPTVTLTSPSSEILIATPGGTPLAASAFDNDGGVAQVAFYAGTMLVGVDTSAPYQLTWTNPLVGAHLVTAVATDNEGATATSASTLVRVLPISPGFGGAPRAVPGVIEAEDFNEGGAGLGYNDLTAGNLGGEYRQTDVDIQTTTDLGAGYALGYVDAGEWLAYSISALASGNYTFQARVASLGTGGTFHVELDGFDVTGPLGVPHTSGWQTWQTVSSPPFAMTGGSHVLRVVMDSRGPNGYVGNFNYFRLTAPGVNSPPSVQLTAPAANSSYLAPATVSLVAAASDADGSVAQVAFYSGSSLLGVDNVSPFTFSWSSVPAGSYSLSAVATDNNGATAASGVVGVVVTNPPVSTPFGGQAAAIPGLIESENFDDGGEGVAYHDLTAGNVTGKYRQTDVDIENTSDVGGGFSLGYVSAGEWLKYSVAVAATGTYTLELRLASAATGGMMHVEVDGVDATGPLAVPATGGWQTWRSLLVSGIPLSAGAHTLRVVMDANGTNGYVANLNFLRWTTTVAGNASPVVQITLPANGSTIPPGAVTVNASATDADGTVTQVAFYADNLLLGVDTTAPYSIVWPKVAVGDYTLTARALDNAGGSTTSAPVVIHVAGSPAPTPFGGIRAAVPGLIELENFDEGGEAVAYHDTSAGNAARQYRQTDVDIEATGDIGGGYALGYVAASEWLTYSIAVNTAGTYTVQTRVATPIGGGSFHIEIDGVNVSGPMTVPNTGGWQTWQTVARTGIPLTAGPHLMRVVFDTAPSNGFVGNFNSVRWVIE